MESLRRLMTQFPHAGRLEWLSRRPRRHGDVEIMETLTLIEGQGIEGDHYSARAGKREVTLLQAEHLPVIAAFCGMSELRPDQLRRNLLVSGLNLLACRQQRLTIGDDVIIEITGPCAPCSRMEQILGPGGYNALRGHGGMTARIVRGGIIHRGDRVTVIPAVTESAQGQLFQTP
ncbi:molybdenum cofactor sulfurase [Kushneria pakistanensis]|uniref:Molybdenum cofactor sulfurase n=1 Tax=Kushneria pakistanensis TaxID=1508770 RepID=A0ABQ3FJY3_9GAMM|nr:MOSC domain-containing protein [Kushneria pakistanensis]GHC27232.1 molybdenum cofactor sulfurase [Kushneria pakistanensis]